MEKLHDTATECHLPYGITQCYLLPDTSEHTPARQAGTRFTDHLRVEGWVSPGPGCKQQRPIVATRQPGASEAQTQDLVIVRRAR